MPVTTYEQLANILVAQCTRLNTWFTSSYTVNLTDNNNTEVRINCVITVTHNEETLVTLTINSAGVHTVNIYDYIADNLTDIVDKISEYANSATTITGVGLREHLQLIETSVQISY